MTKTDKIVWFACSFAIGFGIASVIFVLATHNSQAELEAAHEEGFQAAVDSLPDDPLIGKFVFSAKQYKTRNYWHGPPKAECQVLVNGEWRTYSEWMQPDKTSLRDDARVLGIIAYPCIRCNEVIQNIDNCRLHGYIPSSPQTKFDSLMALGEVHDSAVYRADGFWIESSNRYSRKRRIHTPNYLSDEDLMLDLDPASETQ